MSKAGSPAKAGCQDATGTGRKAIGENGTNDNSSASPSGSKYLAQAFGADDDTAKSESANGELSPSPREASIEYLEELLKDKKNLELFGRKIFTHVDNLLDAEITRVRHRLLFTTNRFLENQATNELPEPNGNKITLCDKVYVPIHLNPQCNFIGRLLGPRGITAKELEHNLGCKLMIRGRGSMKERLREEQLRGQPNFEHLEDELHVLVQIEDAENRAAIKLKRAKEAIERFLVATAQTPEGEDELKRIQLMELAVLNGGGKTAVDASLVAAWRNVFVSSQVNAAGAPCILSTLPFLPTFAAGFPTLLNTPVSLGNLSPMQLAQFASTPLQAVNTPPTPPCTMSNLQVNTSPSAGVAFQQPIAFPQSNGVKFTYPSVQTNAQVTSAMHTPPADGAHAHQLQTNGIIAHAPPCIRNFSTHGGMAAPPVPTTSGTTYQQQQQQQHAAASYYANTGYNLAGVQPCSVYR